ncbi:hypothetical protein KTR66_04605 [Roseococcus sp. SDR]|uniref:hypothetical protein n=1 Tax=Roseococcus sp. SDR TaxID=2835532 RepID=UPI001BCFD4E1|nr:hypothetical protein [Roseococcus sp. SDR]MBS7789260.1 hypothetical protein [Roseococcus sp. SDR]MBV1844574.1 hypothetical protein [Roseococcus sp. SDR]
MSEKQDGGPAFPAGEHFNADRKLIYPSGGMTLRDWFAGQALIGIVGGLCTDSESPAGEPCRARAMGRLVFAHAAQDAYHLADAMLAARAGTKA